MEVITMDFDLEKVQVMLRIYKEYMLQLQDEILDLSFMTVAYANTAKSIIYNLQTPNSVHPEEDRELQIFKNRYDNNLELLRSDLAYGPVVLETLEAITQTRPDETITAQFAKQHIGYVKQFNDMVMAYAIQSNAILNS